MTSEQKRNYNKMYYLKNKDVINQKKKLARQQKKEQSLKLSARQKQSILYHIIKILMVLKSSIIYSIKSVLKADTTTKK